MSESSLKTTSKSIPTRRVVINSADHMPQVDYSSTPGGTLFSTTPGGTRIIYDRKFLLERRSSPVARTPPRGLPDIPGVTSPPVKDKAPNGEPLNNNVIKAPDSKAAGDDAQFEMDI
ncbi:eukaryotic translation initiation factor 4E-binding protein 1 [Gadus macrocephalus]|uniref:eukaryotic translation initiation factor 4E-binding protein 1 n=1 Tax=Gadus macrocephalus TaxID=80720 RepID=UPI0028CB296D|nr:eukaryotic translation initiation factor 4E-binding protein 1 [Gadus macrocephalus]